MSYIRKKTILIILTAVVILAVSAIAGTEYYTSRPEFCSLCHTTEKPDDFWVKSGHKGVECADCHYSAGQAGLLKAELKAVGEVLPGFSTYAEAETDKGKLLINDFSCATSECHQKERYTDRNAAFTENVPLTHKPHEDRTIDGRKIRCGTCHSYMKAEKHFDVSEEACYLCYGSDHVFKVFLNSL
jgi:trimethylamine-N-oxide reductase cytochrome c-type subunit TorC